MLRQLDNKIGILGVRIHVGKITVSVTLAAHIVVVDKESAGQVLLHDGVVDDQPVERVEHLGEALDPEPGLGGDDEVVEDAAVVETLGHPDRHGEVSAGEVRLGVADDEGPDGAVRHDLDGRLPRHVRLEPRGGLGLGVDKGEVDEALLVVGLVVLAVALNLALVAHGVLLVGQVVHYLLQRLRRLVELVLGYLVVQEQVVLNLEKETIG